MYYLRELAAMLSQGELQEQNCANTKKQNPSKMRGYFNLAFRACLYARRSALYWL